MIEALDRQTLEQERLSLVDAVRKDPTNKEAVTAYAAFMKENVIPAMKKEAKPYSFQEYFTIALAEGLRAFEEGSYGVGAVYVYRSGGVEQILLGRQASVNKRNTHLHAEEMVIDEMEALARGETIKRDDMKPPRKAPSNNEERLLVCAVEPCIGCMRRATSHLHKGDKMLVATKDPEGGAMLDGREELLPTEYWRTRRKKKGIELVLPSDDPASPNYINPLYRDLAFEMFFLTRPVIDAQRQKLIDGNPQTIQKAARRSRRRIFRNIF